MDRMWHKVNLIWTWVADFLAYYDNHYSDRDGFLVSPHPDEKNDSLHFSLENDLKTMKYIPKFQDFEEISPKVGNLIWMNCTNSCLLITQIVGQ